MQIVTCMWLQAKHIHTVTGEACTWSQAKHPKPNDKELRESIAFFKQVQKVMPKRRVILDVCGGHGLVAGLFLSFGHCKRAVVLDTFRPKP